MKIEKIVTGVLEENCYILKNNNVCLIIDPGDDYPKIKEVIGDSKILGVLITHAHFDHIGALRNFLTKKGVKIFKKSNLEEKDYEIGPFQFQCIYTPGHSSDSITFYFKKENSMFVGDFIFKGSIGRCDLPTGEEGKMKESIAMIKNYPEQTFIYSGHGEDTTLEEEIKSNPFFH